MKLKIIFTAVMFIILHGCSTYSSEDYGDPNVAKKESLCINIEPNQYLECKEREQTLILSGADKNCNHPYEYEKNRCKREQATQKKALDESLKKHTDK
ncbi:hypothetical protein [Paraglaciecola sp. L3A3]|uniref:hypothetical protein n=1 Tax=Paraglaciecola sp. L3A3 TaxID=2686358 RepID=UPI00131ACAAC|nr:hypothetical protein [Paraglaciecola sp. L3A3]